MTYARRLRFDWLDSNGTAQRNNTYKILSHYTFGRWRMTGNCWGRPRGSPYYGVTVRRPSLGAVCWCLTRKIGPSYNIKYCPVPDFSYYSGEKTVVNRWPAACISVVPWRLVPMKISQNYD
ncbi:unnamed protein product [Macrosiphum euphorbiae]|uniref:Uncharacterized protein n=1 Tax=Macrosiphum euphorbiae TaxID=13131 RepID=A0AAV0XAA1_9HEMI|nr:unnamed protein product [Macrosiphum euphorbiae]